MADISKINPDGGITVYDVKDAVARQKLTVVDPTEGEGLITFGVDANGNYGYKKVGADTVIPFSSGGNDADAFLLRTSFSSSTRHDAFSNVWLISKNIKLQTSNSNTANKIRVTSLYTYDIQNETWNIVYNSQEIDYSVLNDYINQFFDTVEFTFSKNTAETPRDALQIKFLKNCAYFCGYQYGNAYNSCTTNENEYINSTYQGGKRSTISSSPINVVGGDSNNYYYLFTKA